MNLLVALFVDKSGKILYLENVDAGYVRVVPWGFGEKKNGVVVVNKKMMEFLVVKNMK